MANTQNITSRYQLINKFMYHLDIKSKPIKSLAPIVRKNEKGEIYLDCEPVVRAKDQNKEATVYGLEKAKALKTVIFKNGYTQAKKNDSIFSKKECLNILALPVLDKETDAFGQAAFHLISTEPKDLPNFTFTSTNVANYAKNIVALFPGLKELNPNLKTNGQQTNGQQATGQQTNGQQATGQQTNGQQATDGYHIHSEIIGIIDDESTATPEDREKKVVDTLNHFVSFIRANINIAVSSQIYNKATTPPGLTPDQVLRATKLSQCATELIIRDYLDYVHSQVKDTAQSLIEESKKITATIIRQIAGEKANEIIGTSLSDYFEESANTPANIPDAESKGKSNNVASVIGDMGKTVKTSSSDMVGFESFVTGPLKSVFDEAKNLLISYNPDISKTTASEIRNEEAQLEMFKTIREQLDKNNELTDQAKSLIFVSAFCTFYRYNPKNPYTSSSNGSSNTSSGASSEDSSKGYFKSFSDLMGKMNTHRHDLRSYSSEIRDVYSVWENLCKSQDLCVDKKLGETIATDLANALEIEEKPNGFTIEKKNAKSGAENPNPDNLEHQPGS